MKNYKQFSELTVHEQKLRIVKDAIAQIKAGTLVATECVYFQFRSFPHELALTIDLKTVLLNNKTKCEVCAKGALFAACVTNVNEVSVDDDISTNGFQRDKLSKWFKELELNMIEAAFENSVINDGYGLKGTEEYDEDSLAFVCVNFNVSSSPEKRMLAILENILKYGYFNPFQNEEEFENYFEDSNYNFK